MLFPESIEGMLYIFLDYLMWFTISKKKKKNLNFGRPVFVGLS